MSPLDPALVRALHLHRMSAGASRHDAAAAHVAFQTSTLQALLDGRYDGELTVGDLRRHGDLGVGTFDRLDGEMVVVDGVVLQARADGTVRVAPDDLRVPFAVVVPFRPTATREGAGPLDRAGLLAALDAMTGPGVAAVRVDGRFGRLRLRSVPAQRPPYPPLAEVARRQVEWEAGPADAVMVGVRFPDVAGGVGVAGWHLHAATADRAHAGHVLDLALEHGDLAVDMAAELHLELPPGVVVPPPPPRDEVARIEGG